MARLPYARHDRPDRKALVERIVKERGSVLHLYAMLLHSTPVAEGWLNYLTSIRQKSGLAGDIREMVIMRIAHLNGAPYEAEQHAPIALKEGMTQAQLDALSDWHAAISCSSSCMASDRPRGSDSTRIDLTPAAR